MANKRKADDAEVEEEADFDPEQDEDHAGPSEPRAKRKKSDASHPDSPFAKHKRVIDELSESTRSLEERISRTTSMAPTGKGDMCGRIKHVYLENFMCHTKLSFDMIDNVNFVIGHNGSGKSAVLTALTIALKGKASATNRASSMKDLVKHGADRAFIRVILKNKGPSSYQHDIFGDDIIIERTILREGGGGFKIKGSRNKTKVISTTGADVATICDQFSIQVDNPITVLTQDLARAFLATSDAHKKYTLFMGSTGLAQLATAYQKIDGQIDELQRVTSSVKERMPEAEKDHKTCLRKWNAVAGIAAQRTKLLEVKEKLKWRLIMAKEADHAAEEKKVQKVQADIARIAKKIEAEEAKIEAANELSASVEEERLAFHQQQEAAGQTQGDLNTQWKTINTNIRDIATKIKDLKKTLRDRQEDIDRVTRDHQAEVEKSGQQDFEEKRKANLEEREQTEVLIARLNAQLANDTEKRRQMLAERDAALAAKQEIVNQRGQVSNNVARIKGVLTNMQRQIAGNDALARFGSNLQAVREEINRATWHGGAPIGPLGLDVKLKPGNQRYQNVLDAFLSGHLTAWAVGNPRDKATLSDIFRRCIHLRGTNFAMGRSTKGAIPMIFTHAGELFDYSKGDLRHLHPTVISLLEISNPHVERMLVNAARVETVFVANSRADADVVVRKFQRGPQPGVTAPTVIAADLFRVIGTRGGGLQTIPMPAYNGQSLLTTDIKGEIEKQKAGLEVLQQQLSEFDEQVATAERDVQLQTAALAEMDSRLNKMPIGIDRAQKKLEKLESEMQENEPVNLAVYTEAIQTLQQTQNRESDQCNLLIEEHTAAQASLEPIKQQRAVTRDRLTAAQGRLADFDRKIQVAVDGRVEAQNAKKHWQNSLKEYEKTLEIAQADVAGHAATLQDYLTKALSAEGAVRLNPTETYEQLKAEATAMTRALAAQEDRQTESADQLAQKLNASTAKLEALKSQLSTGRELERDIRKALNVRKAGWLELRSKATSKTRTIFTERMEKRGWVGDLTIDHTSCELLIQVITDVEVDAKGKVIKVNKKNSKDPRSLSGGETSFSTMCLLLALWESVAGPFRCLDEFDVFMDAANRKLSMEMLIAASREAGQDRQYILITPQDMNSVQLGHDVKAHRMPDPLRGGAADQGRLPFERT